MLPAALILQVPLCPLSKLAFVELLWRWWFLLMSLCLLLLVVSIWISFFLFDLDFSFVKIFSDKLWRIHLCPVKFYYATHSPLWTRFRPGVQRFNGPIQCTYAHRPSPWAVRVLGAAVLARSAFACHRQERRAEEEIIAHRQEMSL